MPTYFQDADIPALMQDFGVSVTLDSVTALGVVDYVDTAVLRELGIAGVINKAIKVVLQTSQFPSLAASNAVGKPITVDGVNYKVQSRLQESDGALTHLICASS